MAHQSENANSLDIVWEKFVSIDLARGLAPQQGDVFLLVPPYGRTGADFAASPSYLGLLRGMACALPGDGALCVLTSAEDAAETVRLLQDTLRFQLWVAVRLAQPRTNGPGLPQSHAALLVFSKYPGALRHTKTRIGYTYCPACDKTTKDYGGKKHTYHHYGTLMSDVWRDIPWTPGARPADIAGRLADLFGIAPYRRLRVLDLTALRELGPAKTISPLLFARSPVLEESGRKIRPRLIHGDCLARLAGMADDSIDFCFADPPYNLDKSYDTWDDTLEIREYFQWCDRWLGELARVLKPGRTCAVLNIPLWAVRHFQFLKTRLVFQNWIAWEALGLPVRLIMPAHYAIVCFSKGEPRRPPGLSRAQHSNQEREAIHCLVQPFCARRDCVRTRSARGIVDIEPVADLWWDIHRLKHNSRRADHPCQLPPALMRRLIALFTQEGEVVLDPFNGAGTTTLCAAQMGRRYVGIELSEKYHEIAQARHALLDRGGDPFAKSTQVPQAKNSRVRRLGQSPYVVAKKTLQLEVREIARHLGRLPTREEVAERSQYPISYFDEYFASWGEVCAAARTTGMSEVREARSAQEGVRDGSGCRTVGAGSDLV